MSFPQAETEALSSSWVAQLDATDVILTWMQ